MKREDVFWASTLLSQPLHYGELEKQNREALSVVTDHS